jgi:hypothetical protein
MEITCLPVSVMIGQWLDWRGQVLDIKKENKPDLQA